MVDLMSIVELVASLLTVYVILMAQLSQAQSQAPGMRALALPKRVR